MFQLSLRFLNPEDELRRRLEIMTGKSLVLTITDNSTSLISITTKDRRVDVRIHRMFLGAGEEVLGEIADFIGTRKGRTPLIRAFINDHRHCLKKREKRPVQSAVCARGKVYDLKEVFDELNAAYFEGSITASIGWGKASVRRSVRKRTLGTYCRSTDCIRINRILDRKSVPRYFIRYVVYHEMLHGAVAESKKDGRRSVHSPEFRGRERLFDEYERARVWEKRRGV